MRGSIEANNVTVANESSKKLVKILTPLPEVLQELLLTFVGVFQNYNELRHVFTDMIGELNFDTGEFKYFEYFPQTEENLGVGYLSLLEHTDHSLSNEQKGAIVLVDDYFCYNPFHIWFEGDIQESGTLTVESFTSPRGDGTFTVGEIIDYMVESELRQRPHTRWFGAPDHSHVIFEGFGLPQDYALMDETDYSKVWEVFWGS
jgi:hypothetical protein